MTKSLIAFGSLSALALFAIASPVAAQNTLTISGFTCAGGWSFSGSTLTCGGATTPSCTIAGATSAPIGTNTTLTANCTNSPASWAWTGGNCAGGAAQTCLATSATVQSVVYTVTGTNGSGAGPASPNFTVQWVDPNAPSGCTVTPPSGMTLDNTGGAAGPWSVLCTGGLPPTMWAWTRSGACGTVALSTTATQAADTLPPNALPNAVTCTYTVTASNTNGQSTASSVWTVPGSGTISCAGFANTIAKPIAWGTDTIVDVALTANTAFVGTIVVPSGIPNSLAGQNGKAASFNYGSSPTNLWVTLSTTPCTWEKNFDHWMGFGSNVTIWMSVGQSQSGAPALQPGQTYYYNVKATDLNGVNTCAQTTCSSRVELQKPNGD